MHSTSWWWAQQYGRLHGRVSWSPYSSPVFLLFTWLIEIGFFRDIMLDVDWREAIHQDEDQVPGSGVESGHSVF